MAFWACISYRNNNPKIAKAIFFFIIFYFHSALKINIFFLKP
jgi:hypothetical protein